MAEPSLSFLGERIERIQAELRDLRGLRTDIAHLRADVSDRHQALSERLDNVNERLDNFERSIDARFDQMQQTMTTNLSVVLEAITGRN